MLPRISSCTAAHWHIAPNQSHESALAHAGTKLRKASILNRIDLSRFQSSTKLEALHEEIDAMLRRDASAKCIVFSQFTSMLELVQYRLQQVCGSCLFLCFGA